MTTTEVLDPLVDPRWTALVSTAPEALVFHQPLWMRLLAEHYGYEPEAVCVVGHDGRLRAGLPLARVSSRLTGRRLVALPFSDLCPPLTTPGAGAEERAALGRAVAARAIAAGLPLEVRAPFGELGGRCATRHHLHVLDLRGDAAPASTTRRNVGKARRAGVVVEWRADRPALDDFYALHLQTRRRQGVPTQPKGFIRGFDRLFAAGLGVVGLALLDGAAVAAAVFLGTGSTLVYKYGASDRAASGARPNHLLFAEAIERARAGGFDRLDLGRTDIGHEGLRRFKASWGADEQPLTYTYLGREPPAPGRSRAERLLAAVITRTPAVTGRALGAAFYRHAG